MALKVSGRGRISPFIVMDVMRDANRRAASGEDIVHLELGQPSTPAPARVLDAARSALANDRIGYTESLGMAALRDRIARHYGDYYGVDVPADRVVVTTGSSGGFILAFLAAFDAGDRVALADPSYPAYRNILLALGVEPVSLPAGPESRYQPSADLLDRAGGRIDGLIVASPSNPSGTMLEAPEMERLLAYCAERGIRVVSDEIYHGITYSRKGTTALAFGDDAIVVNSFSKYFSMTGWRVGWMVVPDELLRSVECLCQNLFISAPALSQIAALEAFECREELDGHVAAYAANRKILLDGLPRAGFDKMSPVDGAFYIYADVSDLTNDSEALCRRLLAETGIAATPGIDFDRERGRNFVRFSFAGSTADMETAVTRLMAWSRRG